MILYDAVICWDSMIKSKTILPRTHCYGLLWSVKKHDNENGPLDRCRKAKGNQFHLFSRWMIVSNFPLERPIRYNTFTRRLEGTNRSYDPRALDHLSVSGEYLLKREKSQCLNHWTYQCLSSRNFYFDWMCDRMCANDSLSKASQTPKFHWRFCNLASTHRSLSRNVRIEYKI